MRDRRPRKTGGVFAAWISFAAVERSMSDRLLDESPK